MLAKSIKLSDLKTYGDCLEVIHDIESDYRNYEGGLKHWLSGKETVLKANAKAKIAAVEKKANKFPCVE
jgi:hypothetical protein